MPRTTHRPSVHEGLRVDRVPQAMASSIALCLLTMTALAGAAPDPSALAAENAEANREALNRAHDVMTAWLGKRDPNSHLISEHWEKGYWRVENAAADLDLYEALEVEDALSLEAGIQVDVAFARPDVSCFKAGVGHFRE